MIDEALLRRSLDEAADRFEPPPGLRDDVRRRVVRTHHRRAVATAGTVALLLAVAVGAVVVRPDRPESQPVAAGPPVSTATPDWLSDVDPVLGWQFDYPGSWRVDHYERQCRIGQSGTVITNLDRPVPFQEAFPGCTTARDLSGLPPTFVGMEIARYDARPAVPPATDPDTSFPLSFDDFTPEPDQEVATFDRLVKLGNDHRYFVRAWMGPAAAPADRERLVRVIASIQVEAGGNLGIWRRQAVSDDGRTVTIGVMESTCTEFDHVVVSDQPDAVRISAVMRTALAPCRTDSTWSRPVAVTLAEPLGDRPLVGGVIGVP